MFLGTFIPVPKEFAQLVPSYYVTDILTTILLRGAPITSPSILMNFGTIIAFCLLVIIVGIIIFAKFGKAKLM